MSAIEEEADDAPIHSKAGSHALLLQHLGAVLARRNAGPALKGAAEIGRFCIAKLEADLGHAGVGRLQ